jgi:hypothetical protein
VLEHFSAADAVITAINASTSSVVIYFVKKWIKQVEDSDRAQARALAKQGEDHRRELQALRSEHSDFKEEHVKICDDLKTEDLLAREELRRELTAVIEKVHVSEITGREELRKHVDTMFTRLSDVNHEMRQNLGVWMNKVENQGQQIASLASVVGVMTEKVGQVTIAIERLSARLEATGHLRRRSDVEPS